MTSGLSAEEIGLIEEAGFASWPAEEEWRDGGLMVRLSPHLPYQRCTSVNFTADPPDDLEAGLIRARARFGRAGKELVLRETPLMPVALRERLDAEGWGENGHTLVMTRALDAAPAMPETVDIAAAPSPDWLDAYAAFSRAVSHRAIFESVLQRIVDPASYLGVTDGGRIVAVGVMVRKGDLAGLFGIATEPEYRRRGIGLAVSQAALAHAAADGAKLAWLQVLASNEPAVALYRRLGFGTAYDYRYRTLPGAA